MQLRVRKTERNNKIIPLGEKHKYEGRSTKIDKKNNQLLK